MPNRINRAFEEAIAEAADDNERAILEDARRVFEIMLTIDSAPNRQTVIAVLERRVLLRIANYRDAHFTRHLRQVGAIERFVTEARLIANVVCR